MLVPVEYKEMTLGEFVNLKCPNEMSKFKNRGYILKYIDGATTWTSKDVFDKLHMEELIKS